MITGLYKKGLVLAVICLFIGISIAPSITGDIEQIISKSETNISFYEKAIEKTQGSYQIKVKAKDVHGAESPWSDPLAISMPKNRAFNSPFLQFLEWLMDRFPLLEQILTLNPFLSRILG